MRFRGLELMLATLMLMAPVPASVGQTVSGIVYDAVTEERLSDVSVVLLDEKGRIQRGTLTEPDGSFSLAAPQPGRYRLRVGGAGLETWDSPLFELKNEQTRRYDLGVPRAGGARLAAFERRRARGVGLLLTEEQIAQRRGIRFTEVVRHLPGVMIIPLPRSDTLRTAEPSSTVRLVGSYFDVMAAGARQRGEPSEDCPPVVFVDGQWWGSIDKAGDRGPDDVLLPTELVGIEIYTPAQVPDELNSGRDAERCGVIAVWRRRSR